MQTTRPGSHPYIRGTFYGFSIALYVLVFARPILDLIFITLGFEPQFTPRHAMNAIVMGVVGLLLFISADGQGAFEFLSALGDQGGAELFTSADKLKFATSFKNQYGLSPHVVSPPGSAFTGLGGELYPAFAETPQGIVMVPAAMLLMAVGGEAGMRQSLVTGYFGHQARTRNNPVLSFFSNPRGVSSRLHHIVTITMESQKIR